MKKLSLAITKESKRDSTETKVRSKVVTQKRLTDDSPFHSCKGMDPPNEIVLDDGLDFPSEGKYFIDFVTLDIFIAPTPTKSSSTKVRCEQIYCSFTTKLMPLSKYWPE